MARESAAYLRYLEEADHEAHDGFDRAAYDRWMAAEEAESPPPSIEEELAFREALDELRLIELEAAAS